ncbi:acyl-CoA dehydrogenase N-terminal domain-containing protein [Pseudomonas sp. NA-150]
MSYQAPLRDMRFMLHELFGDLCHGLRRHRAPASTHHHCCCPR